MIEAEEIKTEKEKPTETDVRLMFNDLKKPMKALQALLVSAKAELERNGVDARGAKIYIEDGEMLLTVGSQCLRYEERESVFALTGLYG